MNLDGIEDFARSTHRLSPVLINWVQKFFHKHLMMQNNRCKFPLSPCNALKLHLFRGDIVCKGGNRFDRRGLFNLHISEEHAERILAKIDPKHRISLKIELNLFLKALLWTRIFITPWDSLPSGRARSEKDQTSGNVNQLVTTTPCFMLLHLQFWAKGILNKPGFHCGNCFDLTTPGGMALMLHEIYHIYQFRRNPFQMLWWYIRALRDSIVFDRILFSHPRIPFEVEAIAFEYQVRDWLSTPEMQNDLQIFSTLR